MRHAPVHPAPLPDFLACIAGIITLALAAGCAAPGHMAASDPAVAYLAGQWTGTLTDRSDGLLIARLDLIPAGGRLWNASLLLYRPARAAEYSRTLALQLRVDPRADGELALASPPAELLSLTATATPDRRYLAAQVVDRHGNAGRLALSHTEPNPLPAAARR